jgi:superfamily II DNA or RNA helicase
MPKRAIAAKKTALHKQRRPVRASKAKTISKQTPVLGWHTSDEDEIASRRWRGGTDIVEVVPIEPEHGFFGTFRARSTSGGSYEVEIRSLHAFANSCGCIDHRVNGLGTCKHIEGVLAALAHRKKNAFNTAAKAGSPRIEVFLDRRANGTPAISWPSEADASSLALVRDWLQPWLRDDGVLTTEPDRVEALFAAWPQAPAAVSSVLRLSRHFGPWLEKARRARLRLAERTAFEAGLDAGCETLDVLAHPLLPYQRLGALHLAFTERALLADDMGLGKTIQAIAACELLVRRKGIERVLVVCPASLKAEWEEQISRFSARSIRLVFGSRAQRLAAYRTPAFFTIVNYEQVLADADDINVILKPETVVLDEAQRIKNWQTKTARQVKSLRSPYAFVLTGTPVENRIDELYSIVQYLDPEILGPLFRFNRDFYELDDRGRPIGYKNLAELRGRVAPLMLRRRKADVETELPGRTIKNYFVPMAEEQKLHYEDYRAAAAQLIAIAQKRPLTPKEFDRLQQLLACMRMVCDTPAILDPTCRISPKLEELEGILDDLLVEQDRKIIIFSEWERMLAMVRELAGEMGVETAWHTGSIPQDRRRAEINRFKNDPACRLFLSTDSGSVGLNLQVASAVINIDLPWNPAKLEQRIARAWRKNQIRSVAVINLVTEDSIEHSILHLLGQKQALADGLIDGDGDLAALKMPSGRGAFIERMQAMMAAPLRAAPRIVSPEEEFTADLVRRFGSDVVLVEMRQTGDGRLNLLAVLDLDAETLILERERMAESLPMEFIDKTAWLAMRRLANSGLLRFAPAARVLHRSDEATADKAANEHGDTKSAEAMAEAERVLRMAKVLAAGGFPEEVPALLARSLRGIASALGAARGNALEDTDDDINVHRLIETSVLPPEALDILEAASPGAPPRDELEPLIASVTRIVASAKRNEPRLFATAMPAS